MKKSILKNYLLLGLLALFVGITYINTDVSDFIENITRYIVSFNTSGYLIASLPLLQVTPVSKIKPKLEPFFVTGFTDGEGCFSLGLSPTKVQAVFQINLHIKDRAILEDIKTVLGVGYISFFFTLLYFGLFLSDPIFLCAIIPIKIYSNTEADKVQIFSDNKNKSGIYMWQNLTNGKCYIGSAVDLPSRLRFYFSATAMENYLKISKSNIYNAILKYGHSKFSLTILEYCEPSKCLEREGFYQKK